MKPARIILAAFVAILALTGIGGVRTNAYDVALLKIQQEPDARTPFDLTGTVIVPRIIHTQPLVLRDHSGHVGLTDHLDYPLVNANCQSGDIIHAVGVVETNEYGNIAVQVTNVTILGHGPVISPIQDITAAQLLSVRFSDCKARLRGVILEARRDETDPRFVFMMLYDRTETAFITLPEKNDVDFSLYIGAEVEVCGTVSTIGRGKRHFIQQELSAASLESIRIIRTPNKLLESVPELDSLLGLPPSQLSKRGRHRAHGVVIAVLNDSSVFIKTERSEICRAELAGMAPPKFGDSVEIIGIPATDLYHINLLHSIWHPIPPLAIDVASVSEVRADELPTIGTYINANSLKFHGALIRIRGTVSKLPDSVSSDRRLMIESDDRLISIETASLDLGTLSVGSKVEASGVCVLDIELWHPNTTFARVKGYTIVPRSAADIRLLAQPPWWTTTRLLTAIAILFSGLIAILIWNVALRRAAIRKGRELMRKQLGAEREKLKTEERTRLAVELHDTFAQNLTGVAFEVDTALQLCGDNRDERSHLLTIASRALQSCCTDLRNSIWDLRNEALDIPDMDEAIRQTVGLHSGNAVIDVKFNVSRRQLGDDTAHAILRIVRELTINAVRHGCASEVRIKGNRYGSTLLISVRDDGCGFDVTIAPGISEGHFGLQGIRERIKGFSGGFVIKSVPGLGTKAIIKMEITGHG